MITILVRSHTRAFLPNSRLNTPIVPGPQTSCVIKTSAFTHTLSPAWTWALPDARASIFSVNVIRGSNLNHPPHRLQYGNVPGRAIQSGGQARLDHKHVASPIAMRPSWRKRCGLWTLKTHA